MSELMFDINYLIPSPIKAVIDSEENYSRKAEMLLNLLDYEKYYPEYQDLISENWFTKFEEEYSVDKYMFSADSERDFIVNYLQKTKNLERTKELINKLINSDVYDYDTVIAEAQEDISPIKRIDDFEFTDDFENSSQNSDIHYTKRSIDFLLSRKMK